MGRFIEKNINTQLMSYIRRSTNCVKSVQIRRFFWPVFSRIPTKYGEIRSISSYSVRMRENTDQKKLLIWTLFTQWQMNISLMSKELQKKRIGKFETIVHKTSEFLFYPCPFFAFRCVKQNLDIVGKTKQINLENRHGTRFSQIFFLYRYLTKF